MPKSSRLNESFPRPEDLCGEIASLRTHIPVGLDVLGNGHRPRSARYTFRSPEGPTQAFLLKAYTPDSYPAARRAFKIQELLLSWEASPFCTGIFQVPRPVALMPDRFMLLEEDVEGLPPMGFSRDGVDRTDPMMDDDEEEESPDSSGPLLATGRTRNEWLAGRWLALFHGTIQRIPAPEIASVPRQAPGRVDGLVFELGRGTPHGGEARELAAIAKDRLSSRQQLIHGNFHPRCVLLNGERATAVDFEECRQADPAVDLGNFLSRTREMTFRAGREPSRQRLHLSAFLEGYFHNGNSERRADMLSRALGGVALALISQAHGALLGNGHNPADHPDQRPISWGREFQRVLRATDVTDLLS